MLRKLLFTVVPMALPFILYFTYWWGAKKRRDKGLSDVPWSMLFASGLALVVLGLAYLGLSGGFDPSEVYRPIGAD